MQINGKRILVIDDELHVRRSIDGYLTDNGFHVLQAEDGRQGLEVFRSQKPDIILVDLRMPQIDGLDVLAAVTEESPDTPIIVVSGTGVLQDAIEALRLGAWDFITKPIYDMAVLEHSVQKALERSELIRENLRYKEYLEEEVRQRTAELVKKNQEFLKAKEEAEKANLAKSQFLTAMSHELRTPMNGVLGMAQLGLQTKLTAQQRQYFEVIVQSGKALLKILNEILDLSRIEANKAYVEETAFDLEDTIERIIHLFSGSADAKKLSLNCYIPVDINYKLIGDAIRLNQILSNLLANALKFTEEGSIELKISKEAATDSTIQLKFGVSDTGIGISEEQLSLIFEPFTQVDNSATRKYSGAGLGLTIVKNLVNLLGGQIWVESQVGIGSGFWVILPFKKQETEEGAIPHPDFKGAKTLIIDSQNKSSQTMLNQLASWNLRVETADNGTDGIEKLKCAAEEEQRFDLILVDYQLPDKNGIEVAKEIKSAGLSPINSIIITTAIDYGAICSVAGEIGTLACLSKPIIRMSNLLNIFHNFLIQKDPKAKATYLPRKSESSVSKGFPKIADGRRHRLLVVEDDQINRMVIVSMLEKFGFNVDTAANGKEALSLIQKQSYNLVFMDCLMPEMDGFEATREIRNMEKSEEKKDRIPIIAFTAKAMKGDKELCIEAGMDDYLTKPITSGDLQAALHRFLS